MRLWGTAAGAQCLRLSERFHLHMNLLCDVHGHFLVFFVRVFPCLNSHRSFNSNLFVKNTIVHGLF